MNVRVIALLVPSAGGLAACSSTPINDSASAPAPVVEPMQFVAPPPAPKPQQEAATPARPAVQPTAMYIRVADVEVRLGPHPSAPVTNRLYKGQVVAVYEAARGWVRISDYYDGTVEGLTGTVARWIPSRAVDANAAAESLALDIPEDNRILLPRQPGNGLTERDVLILHAAARYYLNSGRATGIADGDKSLSRDGWYYLNFAGRTENTFFRPSDIPDLESRIRLLQK